MTSQPVLIVLLLEELPIIPTFFLFCCTFQLSPLISSFPPELSNSVFIGAAHNSNSLDQQPSLLLFSGHSQDSRCPYGGLVTMLGCSTLSVGFNKVLYGVKNCLLLITLKFLYIIPSTDLALFAAATHCLEGVRSLEINTPKSFSSSTSCSSTANPLSFRKYTDFILCPMCITLHFSALKRKQSSHVSDQLTNLSKSCCSPSASSSTDTFSIFCIVCKAPPPLPCHSKVKNNCPPWHRITTITAHWLVANKR